MKGILFAIAGGLFIGLQQVFNTRLGERIGFWEAIHLFTEPDSYLHC